jgi:hypothetical protein
MTDFNDIIQGLYENRVVPYLGPGALAGSTHAVTGEPIPAGSDSLILAMNDGKPMAPKLMYEFPRAALHDWLASWRPRYVIDINRDTQLQDTYADTPHILIRGLARIAGTDYRFTIHQYDGTSYREVSQDEADTSLPILFKPMGSPLPKPTYIASDADYVDYITELMGGFAIPNFLKEYRKGKQYLMVGLPLNRDSERMVMTDITYASAEPRGWVLNKSPTDKEKRFCERLGLVILDAGIDDLLAAAEWPEAQRKSA